MRKGHGELFLKITAFAVAACSALTAFSCSGKDVLNSSLSSEPSFKAVRSTWSVEKTEDAGAYENLSALNFSAAKGETEGAQFFVRSETDIKDYEIYSSDLSCGNSVISADNVDIYAEIFTLLSESVLFVGSRGAGYYPDCLIPTGVLKNNGENVVKAGENQGFWVDVNVPEDAESGEYKGVLTFKAGDYEKKINVNLTVFGFTMPESPALKTCYLIWNDWLMDTELDNTSEKHRAYYETMLKYNVQGYSFPTANVAEFVEYLTERYDGLNCYGIPYKAVDRYTNDWDYMFGYMYAIGEQCLKDGKNYFDKAYYYLDIFYDEATSFSWRSEQLLRIIDETDAMEESVIAALENAYGAPFAYADTVRGLRHAITTEKYIDDVPEWHGKLNFYVQNYSGLKTSVEIEKYRELIESGDYEIFTYATELNDYPNPAVNISDYPITGRDVYWFDYALGVDGELYWCTNCNVLCTSVQGMRYATIYDPYTQATHDGVSNGGGYYLYPGIRYGSDEPFPSMRLAVKRDGIDDYTYMSLLNDRYGAIGEKHGESLGSRNIVKFINETLLAGNRSRLNDEGLFAARENLAALISMADEYGFAVADAEYRDDGIYLVFYADSGVSVRVNGKPVAGTVSGSGLKFGVVADYENGAVSLTCSRGEKESTTTIAAKGKPELVSGFENGDEKVTVRENYGSRAESSSEVVRGGNKSVAITLSGWTDFSDKNNVISYKPSFSLSLADYGLTDFYEIRFYVYNDGADREYEVFFTAEVNGVNKTVEYDRITLKGGRWTAVTLSDFKTASLTEKVKVKSVGLKTGNIYSGDSPLTCKLYLDDFYAVGK